MYGIFTFEDLVNYLKATYSEEILDQIAGELRKYVKNIIEGKRWRYLLFSPPYEGGGQTGISRFDDLVWELRSKYSKQVLDEKASELWECVETLILYRYWDMVIDCYMEKIPKELGVIINHRKLLEMCKEEIKHRISKIT